MLIAAIQFPITSTGQRTSTCARRGVVAVVVTLGLAIYGSAVGVADSVSDRQQKRIDVIAEISPSVVCVMPPNGQGGGSGVLISADGYAISNYHVTSGSGDFMKCGLNDGQIYDAVIVGIDPTGDVALIKLLGRDDFPFCTPGDSERVNAGDEVLALGNPFLLASDFTPTVTFGIVSGVHRYQYPADTFLEYTDCIQIDASINPGNSGGPLFDIDGHWIGINGRASFEKRGRINSGAAYAISVRQVLMFVDHLKSGRIVDHGRTGFTVSTYDNVVEVQQVSELSEAWRRGLRVSDEVLSFGGRALASANDFKNIVGIFPEGSRVPLVFRSDDGVRKVTVRLSSLHDYESAPQLPEERKPKATPKPGEPDEKPHGHPAMPEEEPIKPPEEYAHLFEKKSGFTNFYFNTLNTERFLKPLQAVLPEPSSGSGRWKLEAVTNTEAGEHVGEITVGANGAGLDLAGIAPQLQSAEDLAADNESPQLHGLLAGMLQLHRLFRNEPELFSEVSYFGSEVILPSKKHCHSLLTRNDAVVARWYFESGVAFPVGVDVHFSAGADEGRLRFDQWMTDAQVPMPGRIGVVDADTETVRWIQISSLDVKKKLTTGASARRDGKVTK